MRLIRILFVLTFLSIAPAGFASEEEELPYREIRIVSQHEATGPVTIEAATTSDGVYTAFAVTVFGARYELGAGDLAALDGFPLQSLKVTHEAGYARLGGHTLHLRMSATVIVAGARTARRTVMISISKDGGLGIFGPTEVILETP